MHLGVRREPGVSETGFLACPKFGECGTRAIYGPRCQRGAGMVTQSSYPLLLGMILPGWGRT